jgi:hypothetical protein
MLLLFAMKDDGLFVVLVGADKILLDKYGTTCSEDTLKRVNQVSLTVLVTLLELSYLIVVVIF